MIKNKPYDQIAIQSLLRPELTPVGSNIDYEVFRQTLEDIKKLLRESGLEKIVINSALSKHDNSTPKCRENIARFAVQSLHTETLRFLLGGLPVRELSREIYRSDLLADFCGLLTLQGIKGASKSSLDRSSKLLNKDVLRLLHNQFKDSCMNSDSSQGLGLEESLDPSVCLIDSTCLEANIHYPIDWLLLKDVSLTLLKATKLIRTAGLLSRMPHEPNHFARAMNRLCIQMTHARRTKDSKKVRKKILRKMKKLLDQIGDHARRHNEKLKSNWKDTDYTWPQSSQIIDRVEEKLNLLPKVKKQAHDRIIGGRKIISKDKILSAHDPDTHVVVRGKSGKEVEFGNVLYLAENTNGFILDYEYYIEQAPSEGQQLIDSLERQKAANPGLPIEEVCSDRGFNSKKISNLLIEKGIYDATCPRSVDKLNERLDDVKFMELQRRRGGTEGRIAILKNKFHGGKLRAKSGENRSLAVAWSVLSHNLWMVAKILAEERKRLQKAA